MGFFLDRVRTVGVYLLELVCHGLPEALRPMDQEVLFVLDGVGGFQFAPLLVRKAIREEGINLGTVYFRWQWGLPGEIFTDLMWIRRNRVMGAKLARKLLAHKRAFPESTIHMMAFSGGAGIAVFALEHLRKHAIIETLILACPALSPDFNLAPALANVTRCYALTSRKDTGILGWGTRILGTTDRRFTRAAGCVGFRLPVGATVEQASHYERLREVTWSPDLIAAGHSGGHTGWVSVSLLRRHVLPLLRGEPLLATSHVTS